MKRGRWLWLWLRHPIRMQDLHYGFCPICVSSPPRIMCPVCRGSHVYGRELDKYTRYIWLLRFNKVVKHY